MGTGSLRRIAALTLLATIAVLAGAAASVPAQISVPSTTVTTPTVTVPSTTVRVPSTTTTVTTPQLSTPKPSVKTPAVKTPTVKIPAVKAPAVKAPAVKNLTPKPAGRVSDPVKSITNTVSGAPSTGSAGGTVEQTLGAVSGAGGTSSGDVATRTIGGAASAPGGMTYFSSPGGSGGGTTGGPGGIFASGPGGFGGGSAAAGGGSLATMLAGASSKELRSVLQQLEGCLPALPAADRRVISLRAGLDGAPLSRTQVGQRVGMSPKGVRRTERRALNRLQFAAANTGCAASVVGPFDPAGIGNLSPQVVLAGAVPVNSASATSNFAQARGIIGQSASPLFELGSGGQGGPAWAIILFTVLLSVSLAALTREVRHSF